MSTAPALTLPDELWIEIFSGYGLEYVDLKCMAGVTKHFNKLEKDAQLDSIMFRKAPGPTEIETGDEVKIHPLLHATYMMFETVSEAWTYSDCQRSPIIYKAVNEYATSPASTEISLNFDVTGTYVQNPEGVTVKDLLEAVAVMWASPDPEMEYLDEDEFDEFYEYGGQSDSREHKSILYLFTCNDGHCVWAGWAEARVPRDGLVQLSVAGYDS